MPAAVNVHGDGHLQRLRGSVCEAISTVVQAVAVPTSWPACGPFRIPGGAASEPAWKVQGFAYSACMVHSNLPDYEELHATVVDALRYDVKGEALVQAAHEVLDRLRDNGLSIPAKPSV